VLAVMIVIIYVSYAIEPSLDGYLIFQVFLPSGYPAALALANASCLWGKESRSSCFQVFASCFICFSI